jgi:hypothetical protein
MKNHHLPLLGIGLAIFAISCKKADVQNENKSKDQSALASNTAVVSNWKTIDSWQTIAGKNSTTYQSKIEDASITDEVISNGLVLVYANNGKSIESLPFEQKNGASTYSWYYQVSEGMINVSSQVRGTGSAAINQNIRYFVLTPQQLEDLQTKGTSRSELMDMSYQQLSEKLGK